MTPVNFGSAHLLVDGMPERKARALLEGAVDAGVRRFDTAPLYGHGRSEALVAAVAARSPPVLVTTKVGLEPSPEPSALKRGAGRLMRSLPPALSGSMRGFLRRSGASSQDAGPSGRFHETAVTASIERSLSRLGRLDRLLLHEVHLADLTDELFGVLTGYVRRGDIGALGVATGNAVTLRALQRSEGIFSVAHVSIDPLAATFGSTASMPAVQFVGHGALGAGGQTLRLLQGRLDGDPAFRRAWAQAVSESPFGGPSGPARALIASAASRFAGELLVATGRVERIAETVSAAAGQFAIDDRVTELLARALRVEPVECA